MPTRYYPAVKPPNAIIRGTRQGIWASPALLSSVWSADQYIFRLSRSKSDAGTKTNWRARVNQQPNYDFHWFTFQTPPLEAQAIAGTIDLCFMVAQQWLSSGPTTNDATVRYHVNVYLAIGQTRAARAVLLNDYIDTVTFPYGQIAGLTWRSLASPQTLTPAVSEAGDTILIEIGMRVISSPTPVPTYPPTAFTEVQIYATGSSGEADAVAGETALERTAWIECSATLTEQADPAPPPIGTTCATAIPVPTLLPSTGDYYDTTQAPGTDRELWYTWTCPAALVGEKVWAHTWGGNYSSVIDVFEGTCGSLGSQVALRSFGQAPMRSLSTAMWTPDPGQSYLLRVRTVASSLTATNAGGVLRLSMGWRLPPVEGDLYVAAGVIAAYRAGQLVNFTPALQGSSPTGLAIDYTRAPMDDLNGGIHTGERLLVGLHGADLVEILDLPTVSYGDFQFEVDYIATGLAVPPLIDLHPAQLVVTAAGQLYVGLFGDGYRLVSGEGLRPAFLDSAPSVASYGSIRSLPATAGDNQAGAPFTPTLLALPAESTAPWAIDGSDASAILTYTSGIFYQGLHYPEDGLPPPGYARQVKRWDLTAGAALPDLATLSPRLTYVGLRGLAVLPSGQVLVCNGDAIQRIDTDGAILQTYLPTTLPDEHQSLVDVVVTPDGLSCWTIDLGTTRLWKFNLVSGAVEQTFLAPLYVDTTTQLVVYAPGGVTPPPPDACPIAWTVDPGSSPPACPTGVLP